MIEAAVLHHHHDDVIDARRLAGREGVFVLRLRERSGSERKRRTISDARATSSELAFEAWKPSTSSRRL
jgi:hypothetical protein